MENFLSKYKCLFSMANEGQVQVGKPMQPCCIAVGAMQHAKKQLRESQGLYRNPVSHICQHFCAQNRQYLCPGLDRVCVDRDRQCYCPGHKPPAAPRAGNFSAILSCKCLEPSQTGITYHCKTAFSRVCLKFLYLLSFTMCPEGQLTQTFVERI